MNVVRSHPVVAALVGIAALIVLLLVAASHSEREVHSTPTVVPTVVVTQTVPAEPTAAPTPTRPTKGTPVSETLGQFSRWAWKELKASGRHFKKGFREGF